MRTCECGQPISEARLKAVPDTTKCISCANQDDTPHVIGMMVWASGKSAPEIEIGTKLAKEQAGAKRRMGAQLPFAQKEGMFGVAAGQQEAQTLHELGERLRRENRGEADPDANLEPILSNPSRCHPNRPAINAKRICLPCAMEQQRLRVRR